MAPLFLQWVQIYGYMDGLVQERRNSSALAMELCLSCTKPSIYDQEITKHFPHHTNVFHFISWVVVKD